MFPNGYLHDNHEEDVIVAVPMTDFTYKLLLERIDLDECSVTVVPQVQFNVIEIKTRKVLSLVTTLDELALHIREQNKLSSKRQAEMN